MCHKIGLSPISTMGFGLRCVSSDNLVPRPPAKITTFILYNFKNYGFIITEISMKKLLTI